METLKAAAVSLYKFATRSTIGDNCPPEYTHYLPLFMIDGNGNPTPVIAPLKSPAGQTASQLGATTFVVKNEYGIKTQHKCGGVHAYISPQNQDLCPEESAYYPNGAHIKALMFNENWIQVYGKKEVPADTKMKQVAQFAHVMPYWQQYGQQSQRVYERPDMRGPDGPATTFPDWPCAFCQSEAGPGSTCDYCDRIVCPRHARQRNCCWTTTCPECTCHCNPPPVGAHASDEAAEHTMRGTARSRAEIIERLVISGQRILSPRSYIGRLITSLLRRSTSCLKRRPKSCHATQQKAIDVAAETALSLQELAPRAAGPRSGPDYDQDKDPGAVSTPDANPNARDESLENERFERMLQMSRDRIRQQVERDETEESQATAQTRRTIEYQKRKIDELKDAMLTPSADVKATFAEIANNQKEHEQDFNMVRAELRE